MSKTHTSKNFQEIWKVPFREYKETLEKEVVNSKIGKPIKALSELYTTVKYQEINKIPKKIAQTIKATAHSENMYTAYLLSSFGVYLNGLDLQYEAEILHRRALCIGIRCIGGNNPKLADSMEWLAYSLYRQGNYGEALLLCTSSVIFIQSSLGMWHNETGTCYQNLATVLYSMGVNSHAKDMDDRANVILAVSQLMQNQKLNHKQKQTKNSHSQKSISSHQKKSEKNSNNNINIQYYQNKHNRNYHHNHNGHGQGHGHNHGYNTNSINYVYKEKMHNNANQVTSSSSSSMKKKFK